MAYLSVLEGANANQTFGLDKDRTVMGREPQCDIISPPQEGGVSRKHACILRVQDKFFIEDLRSRNGTLVNSQRITARIPLKEGDQIRICDSVYCFHEKPPGTKPAVPGKGSAKAGGEEPDEFSSYKTALIDPGQLYEAQPAEKLKAILDISNHLSRTLDLDLLLPQILDSLFKVFRQADRGFIIMRVEATEGDQAGEQLVLKAVKNREERQETMAGYSRSIVRQCLQTVQAFLSADAAQDKRFNENESIFEFHIRSLMCAPLWTQEKKAVGVIQLETQDPFKKFTEDDLQLLVAVAGQASVALQNVKLHEGLVAQERLQSDLDIARQVQLSFLPKRLPKVPGYEFFARYEPAQEVGGDYFDFIPLPRQRLAILLGDVAGKGVPAALLMAKLSTEARTCLLTEPDPARAIGILNDLLCRHTSQMERFVTLVAAVLDYATHGVTLVNAGHPSPLVIHPQGSELQEAIPNDVGGLPLGVMEGQVYETVAVSLQPGDCMVLFSDGVPEAMDKQNNPVGLTAISAALQGGRTAKALGEGIVKNVRQHAAGRKPHDDITLVCLGRAVVQG